MMMKKVQETFFCKCYGNIQAFSCLDTYESGEEFLESGKNYDLLFLDIDMKGMDGIENCQENPFKG